MILIEPVCDRCGGDFLGTAHLCDMELTHKAQTFALNTWLCDYPSDMTYEQIVEALDKDKWSEPDDGWKDKNILTKEVIDDGVVGELIAEYIRITFKRAMGLIGEVKRG
jgi:hypothetical protein